MYDLAILYKLMNLYFHNAHNLVSGPTFHEDHAFFGSLYEFADDSYDSIVERMIGNDEKCDLVEIAKGAASLLDSLSEDYYKNALVLLEEGVKLIDEMSKSGKIDVADQNLIQGQADSAKVFIYKAKRRMK